MLSNEEDIQVVKDIKNSENEEDDLLLQRKEITKIEKNVILKWIAVLLICCSLSLDSMGYQGILPALYKSGQFQWLCSDEEANQPPSTHHSACGVQQQRLDLLFTLGYAGLNVAGLPLGFLLKKCRPSKIVFWSFVAKSLAYILLAFGTDGGSFLGISSHKYQYVLLLAYPMVSVFGFWGTFPFLCLPDYLFPAAYVVTVKCTLLSAVDFSSVWYYLVRIMYVDAGISFHAIFIVYAALALAGAFASHRILKDIPIDGSDSPLQHSFLSLNFFMIFQWLTAFMVTKYFYMTNLLDVIKWVTGSEHKAYTVNVVFSVLLPLTGLLIPATSWIINKGYRHAIVVNLFFSIAVVVFTSVDAYPLQLVFPFFLAGSRFLVFSIVPPLCSNSKVFGDDGNIIFCIIGAAAGFVTFSNLALGAAARSEDTYLPYGIGFGVWCLLSTVILYKHLTNIGVA